MKININEQFTVTLTEYGAKVYNKHFEDLYGEQYKLMKEDYKPKVMKEGDKLKEELWQLMQIFGTCLYMGNTKIPFNGNYMYIGEEL